MGASPILRRCRKWSRWCASYMDSGNRCGRYRRRSPRKVISRAAAAARRIEAGPDLATCRSLGCLSLTLSGAWMRLGCSRLGTLAGVRSQRMPPRFVSHRRAFAGRPHAAPPVSSPGLRARQGLAAVNGKMAIQSRRAGGDRPARDCKNGRKCLHSAAARGCRSGPRSWVHLWVRSRKCQKHQ